MTEKIASEIGRILGIACANVELCTRHGRPGCLIEDLRWSKGALHPGQLLLSGAFPDYDYRDPEHRGHSLSNIKIALAKYGPPPNAAMPDSFRAFDAFAGYLVFDALIANTDRHDGNWAVLTPPPGEERPDALCGSYDHASSLGFNLTDDQRTKLLDGDGLERWARRGSARQFEHVRGARRQSLVQLAHDALGSCDEPETQTYWLQRIEAFEADQAREVVGGIANLSEVTATFTVAMLMVNRRRLLDDI